MFIKNLLCLFFITISFSALSEVRFPEIPSKSQPLSVQLQTEFFRSQANYTTFGQYVDLPENDFFQYIAFHPTVSYSPFKRYISFSLFANSFFAKSPKHLLPFQVSLAGAGASFYHKIKTLFIGLELRGGFPLYKNFQNYQKPNKEIIIGEGDYSEDPIVVGDGAYFAEPGLWLIFQPSKIFHIYNHTAFRWRSAGLSSLLFASLGGVLESEFITAGLSLDTFFSLFIHDQFSTQPEQRLKILKTANAGSLKFYSVNPSVLSATAWTEFKFKPFFTTLYVNLDTMGKNYAKGFSLGLVTKFRWSTKTSFIHKKRKNNDFLNFEDFDEEETSPQEPEEKTYFEEEDDSSLYQMEEEKTKSQGMNQELKDELNLLTDD
ncbi:MAG: hypothetical protein OXJ52_05400 [Oligoflexia bacterium]|nr:hypothetical protein [Oligoflexia bacterium]